MHPILSVVLAVGLTGSVLAHAARLDAVDTALVGRIHPVDAAASTPAFTVERTGTTTRETRVLVERFKDREGATLALLKTTYASGALQSIHYAQLQTKETASADFRDGRVFFTQTANGTTKTAAQAVEGPWVALSAVPDEIVRHWDGLVGGEALKFAIPVPVLRDHFAFEVAKQRSWTADGRRLTAFRMQPSSMVIRLMADDFEYVFDDESRTLVAYRGVTIAKTVDDGKAKDLKARIVYSPAPASALDR